MNRPFPNLGKQRTEFVQIGYRLEPLRETGNLRKKYRVELNSYDNFSFVGCNLTREWRTSDQRMKTNTHQGKSL